MRLNKYFIGAILWALLILVLTLTPSSSLPSSTLFSYDKLGHVVIFLVLSYLFVSGLNENNPDKLKFNILLGIVITVIYGACIEISQSIIPERGMELYDLVANCSGSILGISMFYISIKKKWQ